MSEKNFQSTINNYIKYISSKVKDTKMEGDNVEYFKQMDEKFKEYLNKITGNSKTLNENLVKEINKKLNIEEDAGKIEKCEKELKKKLELLTNEYKKWCKDSLKKIDNLFTTRDQKKLDEYITQGKDCKDDDLKKKNELAMYKEIKNNVINLFLNFKEDPTNKNFIKKLNTSISKEFEKQKKKFKSEYVSGKEIIEIDSFSSSEEIQKDIKECLRIFVCIYEKYLLPNSIDNNEYYPFFLDGQINLFDLYINVFDQKENIKNIVIKGEEGKAGSTNTEISIKQIYDNIKKLKEEIKEIDAKTEKKKLKEKKAELAETEKELRNLYEKIVDITFLKYFDMNKEMAVFPFDFDFEKEFDIKKTNDDNKILIDINNVGKDIEFSKQEDNKVKIYLPEQLSELGYMEEKTEKREIYNLMDVFKLYCYLYRFLLKDSIRMKNNIELYNNAILSRTNENSLYSMFEKIRITYTQSIKDYIPQEDQRNYIESEWEKIFEKTENNGYWKTEFANGGTDKEEFKNFVKNLVLNIADSSSNNNPLSKEKKIEIENKEKREEKYKIESTVFNNDEDTFYSKYFRKIDGNYCLYLKDVFKDFKIDNRFITLSDLTKAPLINKAHMNDKNSIFYYKYADKECQEEKCNIIKENWAKNANFKTANDKDSPLFYDNYDKIVNNFRTAIKSWFEV